MDSQEEVFTTDAGNDTNDRVFLLSIDEANNYFVVRDLSGTNQSYWWLRSPANFSGIVTDVSNQGGVDDYGFFADSRSHAVRPAMWIIVE
jgi:hypothetical protein